MNLKNSQYQAIMREYDIRQAENRLRQSQRYEEVIKAIPSFEQIEADIASLYASKARAVILGETNAEDYTAQVNELQAKKEKLLSDAGYPANYLDMTYTCPDCKDTGFIGNKKCHCFKQAVVNLLYNQSNIHEVLERENFKTFNLNFYSAEVNKDIGMSPRKHIISVVKNCQSFIRNFDTEHRNLLFYGDTGVGKTFLTNCIAKELLDTAHTVIYLTAFNLVEILQQHTFGTKDDDVSGETMFDYILDCDLLIVDDLGTEMNNTFITSQLFLCINERLLRRKSTIISTNLSLDQLQNEYSERIFSRLISNYDIMPIFGDDIRIKKAIS